jgi:hypothetical protein
VSVDRQPGSSGGRAALRSVDVSYDDGATWRPVELRKVNGHWRATVNRPASGCVSLRAGASDAGGNTVRQTIIRAYRLG